VLVGLPGMLDRPEVDQADHRHDDHRRQHRLRQVIEQRRQQQQGQQYEQPGKHRRHAGLCAGIDIHGRARERTGDRESLRRRANEVGQPLTDQFLIRVDLLLGLGGDGLGNRDGLHETDQRNHDSGRQQLTGLFHGERRQAERRQPRRNGSHHLATRLGITRQPRHRRGQHNRNQHPRQLRRLFANHPHDDDRGHAHRQRHPVRIAHPLDNTPDVIDEGFGTPHRHADQLVDLRQTDNHRRCIGKANDDRMREEVHHHTEFEHAQHQLDDANHQREHDGQGHESIRARCRQRCKRRGCQQRRYRHRASPELVRRAPHGRHHHRQEGRIEAVVRRQTSELRIGHRLGDQYQRHGQAGHEIGFQDIASKRQPGEKREKFLRVHGQSR